MPDQISRDEMQLAIVQAVNKSEKAVLNTVRSIARENRREQNILHDKLVTKLNGMPQRLTLVERAVGQVEKDIRSDKEKHNTDIINLTGELNGIKVKTNIWGGISTTVSSTIAFVTALIRGGQ